MFRQILSSSLKTPLLLCQPRVYYQNFVMNDTLAQLERECERYCPVPRFPPQKVTVLGAGSDVGRIACLFLKQQRVIRTLSLYEDDPERGVFGVANDIAHIDTSTAVRAYQGRVFLKDALDDADVVVICGGHYLLPPCCNTLDRDLFMENMPFVRTSAIACAQFAPHAIIAIQTPPVDANYALVRHTMKIARNYDKRRVMGMNAVNAMRANQLFCAACDQDPSSSQLPVICGTGRCTRVPVFSGAATKAKNFPMGKIGCLTRLVREADEIICRVKSNNEQGHLSLGFSTARFATCLMKGLFETSTYIDSALVEQADPEKCYGMKYCATPLKISKGGSLEYLVPEINDFEKKLLKDSRCDLEDSLNLGRCFAHGEEYYLHPCKLPQCYYVEDCPVVKPCSKKQSN
ncbi:malate dehydrogenase-like [Anticarsia gemmatalis]|uniref:malate dehydrogenase-like n=1 Tax=Anticarsia gemmatalis TaxID=129554 RepID=UPI003F776C65